MSIVKYTPFAEFDTFPAGLRVFQDTVNRLFSEPNGRPWVPAVDIQETENELIVKADIPDVDMKDIDVRMENGTLTLRGERKFGQEKNEGGWHRLERGRMPWPPRRSRSRPWLRRRHRACWPPRRRGERPRTQSALLP